MCSKQNNSSFKHHVVSVRDIGLGCGPTKICNQARCQLPPTLKVTFSSHFHEVTIGKRKAVKSTKYIHK